MLKVLRFIFTEPSNRGERIKRLIYAVFWQIWKRTFKIPLVLKLDNGARYIAYPDEISCSFPIYAKIYESKYILFLRSYLKNKGVMIDVGANIGLYPLSLKDEISTAISWTIIKMKGEHAYEIISPLDAYVYS